MKRNLAPRSVAAGLAAVASCVLVVGVTAVVTGASSGQETETPDGPPPISVDGELLGGQVSALKLIVESGKAATELGWEPREQGVTAVVAVQSDGLTVLLGSSPSGDVCVALVLSDWEPSVCAPASSAATGRLFLDVQAHPSSPRIVAGVVPDGAAVTRNGERIPVQNNVWVTTATSDDDLKLVTNNGLVTIGLNPIN